MDWWRGAVIYQIYPRSFLDTNGDGIGDLQGITARLDHVASLGADAIWLCPFFASPQHDFGYDVADYCAVDPVFGSMADFDTLLRRAHDFGLKVLIDQVWSHTSNQHPWFLASRASRTGSCADWYVWADPQLDGTAPNNWLSVFGGAAWTWEPRRRQYYLHHFLSHQPALNLHNPSVMDTLLDTGRFWLDRGVDGFRLDAIDFLLHDQALRCNPAVPPAGTIPVKVFGMQRHLHDMLQPQAREVLARIRGLVERYPGTVTLGEISS
jgi:alpha-glucosidase